MAKATVIAWNCNNPTFMRNGRLISNDYAGLCDLNGFLYSTGLTVSGRRWWYSVEA